MIETALAEAQAAYDKMMSGAARFRMVLHGAESARSTKWRRSTFAHSVWA